MTPAGATSTEDRQLRRHGMNDRQASAPRRPIGARTDVQHGGRRPGGHQPGEGANAAPSKRRGPVRGFAYLSAVPPEVR